jgi:hypothetical protein
MPNRPPKPLRCMPGRCSSNMQALHGAPRCTPLLPLILSRQAGSRGPANFRKVIAFVLVALESNLWQGAACLTSNLAPDEAYDEGSLQVYPNHAELLGSKRLPRECVLTTSQPYNLQVDHMQQRAMHHACNPDTCRQAGREQQIGQQCSWRCPGMYPAAWV